MALPVAHTLSGWTLWWLLRRTPLRWPDALMVAALTVLADFDLTDDERATILAGLRSTGGGASLDQRPRLAGRIV